MNFFVYLPRTLDKGAELLRDVAPFISEGSLEIYRELPELSARLRKLKSTISIALLWIANGDELKEIGAWHDFLAGVRTVLILPDEDAGTIALAHKIRPAYIAYADDDLSEVVSVLRRLALANGPDSDRQGRADV